MSHRNWKIVLLLIFLLLLTVFFSACANDQTEDVGELVLQSVSHGNMEL